MDAPSVGEDLKVGPLEMSQWESQPQGPRQLSEHL